MTPKLKTKFSWAYGASFLMQTASELFFQKQLQFKGEKRRVTHLFREAPFSAPRDALFEKNLKNAKITKNDPQYGAF